MFFFNLFYKKKEINFIKNFNKALFLAYFIPIFSIVGIFFCGINWGIDFTGGSELQIGFNQNIQLIQIRKVLNDAGFPKNQVQSYGSLSNNEFLIRVEKQFLLKESDKRKIFQFIKKSFLLENIKIEFNDNNSEKLILKVLKHESIGITKKKIANIIENKIGYQLRRDKITDNMETVICNSIVEFKDHKYIVYTIYFNSISSSIKNILSSHFGEIKIKKVNVVSSQVSKQFKTDGLLAFIFALFSIMMYIAFRFDVFFSPGAIVALIYDVSVSLLIFVVFRYKFDLSSVAALLTIVGYSINNTIVIYDRIREILPGSRSVDVKGLEMFINKAINDTLSRTINTSITTLFASFSLWFFSDGTIKNFAFVLSIGIILGVFSSTYIAPAVYLYFKKHFSKSRKNILFRNLSREDKIRGVV